MKNIHVEICIQVIWELQNSRTYVVKNVIYFKENKSVEQKENTSICLLVRIIHIT